MIGPRRRAYVLAALTVCLAGTVLITSCAVPEGEGTPSATPPSSRAPTTAPADTHVRETLRMLKPRPCTEDLAHPHILCGAETPRSSQESSSSVGAD
jgi:hypothetical protein